MAGRVLRDSRGRFKGSTGGWGGNRSKSPFSNAKSRKQIVRHTVKQASWAGGRGAARAVVRGAGRGAVRGLKAGGAAAVVSVVVGRSLPKTTIARNAAIAVGGATVAHTALGVLTSRPTASFKASATASAALGLGNRKRAASNRAKAVIGAKLRRGK